MCRSACAVVSHGRVRERPEQVVARVDPGDGRDPAQPRPEQEEDDGERRDRADAAEPPRERVEAQHGEDRQDEAVERQDRQRIHAQHDERRRRQVAQVVVAQRKPGEQRVLGREVAAEGEPGDDPEVGRPVAPDVLVAGPQAVRTKRQRARPEQRPARDEQHEERRRPPVEPPDEVAQARAERRWDGPAAVPLPRRPRPGAITRAAVTTTQATPIASTTGTLNPNSVAAGTRARVPATMPSTAPYATRSRGVSHRANRSSAAIPGDASAARNRSERSVGRRATSGMIGA